MSIFSDAFTDEIEKLAKSRKKESYPSTLTAAGRGAAVGAGLGSLGSLLADKVPSYWSLSERVQHRLGRATRHGLMGAAAGAGSGVALRHLLRPESKGKKKK